MVLSICNNFLLLHLFFVIFYRIEIYTIESLRLGLHIGGEVDVAKATRAGEESRKRDSICIIYQQKMEGINHVRYKSEEY